MDQVTYFHTRTVSCDELELAKSRSPMFEIDVAWGYSPFSKNVIKGMPYIGHPQEYYTELGWEYPENNVSLEQFKNFLINYPSIQVLIDVKDIAVLPFVEKFVNAVGAKRCTAHAFVKDWVHIPQGVEQDPHWYCEDIDLFSLDRFFANLAVPLIANCRAFDDAHVEKNGILKRMLVDSQKCESIVALGLYYSPDVQLPKIDFLKRINGAGYAAWVNANVEGFEKRIGDIKYIAMSDDISTCTQLP
ncbi:MAG: hypothetical protein S4CHLAM45_06730 [Chlamydiales bacterium]|nr:hypothetical protein [Chlamydiales bacterium]MCH9620309.1 hypothetical protein [Chlamydiales bacterium]MCH9622780.1 hypothetical protein [Chlamydiales bacterium]